MLKQLIENKKMKDEEKMNKREDKICNNNK